MYIFEVHIFFGGVTCGRQQHTYKHIHTHTHTQPESTTLGSWIVGDHLHTHFLCLSQLAKHTYTHPFSRTHIYTLSLVLSHPLTLSLTHSLALFTAHTHTHIYLQTYNTEILTLNLQIMRLLR